VTQSNAKDGPRTSAGDARIAPTDDRGQGPRITIPADIATYTVIPDHLFHPGMSARAWGVYTYLRSRPPGWDARVYHLINVFREGRDAIYTVLAELVELGLMAKVSSADPDNPGLIRWHYVLGGGTAPAAPVTARTPRSAPAPGNPDPANPDPASPDPEDPPQTKKDLVSTDPATTDRPNLPAARSATAAEPRADPRPASTRGATSTGSGQRPEKFPPTTPIEAPLADGSMWEGHLRDYPVELIPQDARVPAELVGRVAHHLTTAFVAWWKSVAGLPEGELIDASEGRNVIALQNQFVAAELAIGRTPLQVRRALAACAQARPGVFLPDRGLWRAKLTAARSGRDPGTAAQELQPRRGRPSNVSPVDRSAPHRKITYITAQEEAESA
jgi:hypothetical protein